MLHFHPPQKTPPTSMQRTPGSRCKLPSWYKQSYMWTAQTRAPPRLTRAHNKQKQNQTTQSEHFPNVLFCRTAAPQSHCRKHSYKYRFLYININIYMQINDHSDTSWFPRAYMAVVAVRRNRLNTTGSWDGWNSFGTFSSTLTRRLPSSEPSAEDQLGSGLLPQLVHSVAL